MAHFFFHIKEGDHLIEDEEGIDLPDASAARAEALQAARELWADAIKAGKELSAEAFVIVDERGRPVASVSFSEALPSQLRGQGSQRKGGSLFNLNRRGTTGIGRARRGPRTGT